MSTSMATVEEPVCPPHPISGLLIVPRRDNVSWMGICARKYDM
jgi:hypothetical protein